MSTQRIVLAAVAIGYVASGRGLGQVLGYGGHAAGAAVGTVGAAVTITVAGFADSGTMTADFTRWSRSGRGAVGASLTAFPVANVASMTVGGLVVAAGAATDPATNGGDFLGILIGDFFGLGIAYLQQYTGLFKLPEESYYMSVAAVNIHWIDILLINVGTFAICTLILEIPSRIIRRITPVKAIQFK